ncbi:MAG: RNA polymerase sigma factor [Acidimicrobiia bacterium]
MASGLTDPAMVVQEAAKPVLRALAGADPVDHDQVPDLLATVTERVLRRLRRGAEIEDLVTYAKQAARNVFSDWLRSKRRERTHRHRDGGPESLSTPLAERLAASSLTPSSAVVRRDDQRRHALMIQAAVAGLSAKERAVLQLRFVEGRTSAEVAEILGYRSPAVVDVTVSRARKKLRDQLPPSLMGPILGLGGPGGYGPPVTITPDT